jgi:hypothetical protein
MSEQSEHDAFREALGRREAEHAARVKAHEEVVASAAYQNELKFISGITLDVVRLLESSLVYSSRAGQSAKDSLVIRSTDDLGQSVLAARNLIQDGLINPIKRELRYIIESSVKNLYVDQQVRERTASSDLDQKLESLEAEVGSSIDVLDDIDLEAFHKSDEKKFKDEVYDAYRKACAYVHVSRHQIEERLERAEAGKSLGFESAEDLRKVGRLMFRVYDIALTLYFHGYGLPMTGDIFIQVLDDFPSWRFHKGKYVRIVSAYFDYKHERNMRKYGEAKSWSPDEWPPKRL